MAVAQARRTHCPRGHEYDESNTCHSGGRRHCLACGRQARAAKALLRGSTPRPPKHPKPAPLTTPEKLWRRFQRSESGCWLWTGYIAPSGYGFLGKAQAHRPMYELLAGPIPNDLVVDHLCRNRACVNPMHMEPVTIAVNVLRGESGPAKNARKTHCAKGHPYDTDNTHITPDGWRMCKTCNRERARENYRKRRAERAA